jgi:Na+/H+ antiporter NhaB
MKKDSKWAMEKHGHVITRAIKMSLPVTGIIHILFMLVRIYQHIELLEIIIDMVFWNA